MAQKCVKGSNTEVGHLHESTNQITYFEIFKCNRIPHLSISNYEQ